MIPTSKITILLVDDKLSFGEAFSLQHDGDEFEIYHELYLSKAEERLRADFYRYDFVILDGLGHTVEGLSEDRGEEKHAHWGIDLIKELSQSFGRKLPCCVYTAYLSDKPIKSLQEIKPDLKIFEKGSGESAMLQYIREEHVRSTEATFRMKHPEITKIFKNGWLVYDIEQELIKLFTETEAATQSDAKHTARRVRGVMEAVFTAVANVDRSLLSDTMASGDDLSLSNAIWIVAGRPDKSKNRKPSNDVMPVALNNMVSALQKSTSRSVMHHNPHPISRYTLASYANTLADLLLWFSDFMQKRS